MAPKRKKIAPSRFADIYYTPGHPAAYTGDGRRLAKAVGATLKETTSWLRGQDPYTLLKTGRKKFKHDRILVQGLDEQWSVDLISVIPLAEHNKGFKYILTAVDTLSKYAFAKPLKNKTGVDVAAGLKTFFDERAPKKIRTDLGKEFYNEEVQNLFRDYDIKHFGAYNYTKASIVERFHRTLRARLWRYFQATNTWKYLDVLPKMIDGYNRTVHRSTAMAPKDVNEMNQWKAWNALYGDMVRERKENRGKKGEVKRRKKNDLRVGDMVRLSKYKHIFEKGYTYGWTTEKFVIDKILPPLTGVKESFFRYKVKDSEGEVIRGSFQREELQRVDEEKKVVKKTVARNAEGKVVLWRGYPNSLRTFIAKEK